MNSIWFQLSFCCVEIRHPIWFDHNICMEHSFFVSVMQGRKMDMNQFLQRPNGWQACDVWWSLGYNTELDSAFVRCFYRALFLYQPREMNFCRMPPMARLPLFLFLFWKWVNKGVILKMCRYVLLEIKKKPSSLINTFVVVYFFFWVPQWIFTSV